MSSKRKNSNHSSFLSTTIPNPKERKNVLLYSSLSAGIGLAGLILIFVYNGMLMMMEEDSYNGFVKQVGSVTRIVYFIVLSMYPVYLLLKWKSLKEIRWRNLSLKRMVQFSAKFLRKWHVPLALLATAGVLLHGVLALIRDFPWDFTYITGILSTGVLIFLVFMGFKRFKRKDQAWHLKLAIAFTFLFMIHASF
ncbi:hypothetical protein FGG79_01715 [Bacillus sp. BHET2]|uniref:hypothetical protein n=1 Tax=Bacillus sp. BHET2 TaxID=2583818 RepID=UPI00110E7CD3|nr:hypothetical protein [Bacillus sp. BHET2]TMU86886.1 hypothetical protein FGG79_01715 [Bacillus sp. BHET2]